MPISTPQYLDRLKVAIGSPEAWDLLSNDWQFRRALLFYWAEIAKDYQSFGEMNYYSQFEALDAKSDELLQRIEANVPYWRESAIAKYSERTIFFKHFRHLTQSEHDKHWVRGEIPVSKVIDSTRSGPAKYIPRYP